ncbi:MAG TPA: hypothetical protein VL024_04105, partial [Castellaniella sp.]|nr:hypothetical protein [Castellaniella sp.]
RQDAARANAGPGTPPNRSGTTSRRRRHGGWASVFALMGGVTAWSLQVGFGEGLTAQICHGHDPAVPLPGWMMPSITSVTVVALLIALLAAGVAWWDWSRTDQAGINAPDHALDTLKGRQHFLATAGLLFSALFLIGLLAAGLALWLVSPCSAWR